VLDILSKHPLTNYIRLGIDFFSQKRMVPTALADHVENNGLQGKLRYDLFVGASSGAETENRWARLNMIKRRSPHQVGKEISKAINNGEIQFFDKHLSMSPSDMLHVCERANWLLHVFLY